MKLDDTKRADRSAASRDAQTLPRALHIGVFGGLSLSVAGRGLVLPNRKARAILAYLALEDFAPASRDRLAGLLWAESADRSARNSLRQTLFEIREALERADCAALLPGRDEVQLDRELAGTDFSRALADIAAGQLPNIPPDGAELLLAGYEDLSPLFAEWLDTARSAAQARLMRALESGFTDARRPAEFRRALAELTLRLDRLHETACRTVMQLAATAGEIGIALRAHAALYEAMDRDLGMEPSEATQALLVRIKQGHFDQPAGEVGLVRPMQSMAVPAAGGAPVVAVLPLRLLGLRSADQWVAEGIVEDIVRVLSGLREPVVISTNSTRHLRADDLEPSRIGALLGAQHLVSGSLRMQDNRGRLAMELVDARSGALLWSQAFEFNMDTLFDTQEAIAARIAHTMVPHVNASELRRTHGARPEHLDAYHLMLQARALMFRLERQAFEEAGALLAEAVARDPYYGNVHATLAGWYSIRCFQGWSDDMSLDIAALAGSARKAIALDPGHARALGVLAHHLALSQGQMDEALKLIEQATRAAPNDAEALMWGVPTLTVTGSHGAAVERAKQALSLSPHDPFLFRYQHFLSLALYGAGEYGAAAEFGLRSYAANPNYTSNIRVTAACLAATGELERARHFAGRHQLMQPEFRISRLKSRSPAADPEFRGRFERHLIACGVPF
jgi:DNA-binding SARP family transcriptional activator/TolB-like protein/Tfp pilus assembly protein PilF